MLQIIQKPMQRINRAKIQTVLPNFIAKLVQLINEPNNSPTVIWMPNGNGFRIMDADKFVKLILPKYYRHCKMASFIRQLNMYGFHKLKETDFSYYHHEYFRKDHPNLLSKISRKPEKKLNDSMGNSDKQNSCKQNSSKFEKEQQKISPRKTFKKKVTFQANLPKEDENKKNNFYSDQIMSNVSIKYQCEKNNQLLILGENNENENNNLLKLQDTDAVSLGNFSESHIPRASEFLNSSTNKLVLWGPSQIMKDDPMDGQEVGNNQEYLMRTQN